MNKHSKQDQLLSFNTTQKINHYKYKPLMSQQ